MENDKAKQYIYIVQASLEPSKCKIGKTINLERRLNEYNNMTGKSKENIYRYLYTCEVNSMTDVEDGIKRTYSHLREEKNREIFFYNSALFEEYVKYIKTHKAFVQEIFIKADAPKPIVQIIKKTTPSLEERGLSQKDVIQKAKQINNDEFYTRYEDVEKELSMYDKSIWKDKVIFCNCDDAVDDEFDKRRTSVFPLYFLLNFDKFGLKKLICTHYSGVVDLFNQGPRAYVFTRYGFGEIHRDKKYHKNYTGSFDDPLSLKILNEEADIVCTNPPFSIAIEYWDAIIKSGKKFLIISNITNTINTAFIPYFMNNKVWAGYNEVDWFLNHKRELTRAAGHWFTNLPIEDRPKYKLLKIVPLSDIPAKHRKFDDSKTLLVSNCYIPNNYKKPFAVSARPILNGLLEKGYKIVQAKRYTPYINGKERFAKVLVQKI